MQESAQGMAKGITQETGRSRRQRAGRELEKAELKAREKPNLIQADFFKGVVSVCCTESEHGWRGGWLDVGGSLGDIQPLISGSCQILSLCHTKPQPPAALSTTALGRDRFVPLLSLSFTSNSPFPGANRSFLLSQ